MSAFSLLNLGAILAKEFIQMRRDRVTFAMMLGIPVLLLILFGYAINTDPKRLDAALLAMGRDPYSRAIAAALEVSNYYRFVERPDTMAEAEDLVAPAKSRSSSSSRAISARGSSAATSRSCWSSPTRPIRRRRAARSRRSPLWRSARCCARRAARRRPPKRRPTR